MLNISIIAIVPELLSCPFNHSIIKRAQSKGLVNINIINLRDYATDKHKTIDDYAYGGGAGMVLMIEPIALCIENLKKKAKYDEIIYMSPDGEPFNQNMANNLSLKKNLIILCGHYKGVDERVRKYLITKEISIGDYVLTGGELPAAIICDSIIRLLPGVISDETSALTDSFQDNILAPPVYTRPVSFHNWEVPHILLSGHHNKIEEWKQQQAILRTKEKRPDLLSKIKQ